MAMEDGGAIGVFGYIILFVIVVVVIWLLLGGLGGFGNCGNRNGCDSYGFENFKATCNAEKAEIINTARTQYLTEQQSALTRETINAQSNLLGQKIDYYQMQDAARREAEKDRKIMELTNQLFVKDQLAPVNAQLADIRCRMLPKPDITGIGVSCPNAGILNGLGFNGFNNCNHNCNNGNII